MQAASVSQAPSFTCRRCGGRVPAGPLAAIEASHGSRVLLDRACPSCNHRALYRATDAVG